jgi:type IV secretion system protein VirD4
MIGCAIQDLKRSYAECREPVFLFLDEFPQLGHLRPIEDMMAYGAGYALYLWLFIQDLSQIQRHYAQSWRTLIANATTRSFFGIRDLETAKLVSEMIGQTTVAARGFTETENRSLTIGESTTETRGGGVNRTYSPGLFWDKLQSRGVSENWSESTTRSQTASLSAESSTTLSYVGRRLMTPEELLIFNPLEQLVFIAGHKPIRAALLPYYRHPLLAERAGRWRG